MVGTTFGCSKCSFVIQLILRMKLQNFVIYMLSSFLGSLNGISVTEKVSMLSVHTYIVHNTTDGSFSAYFSKIFQTIDLLENTSKQCENGG